MIDAEPPRPPNCGVMVESDRGPPTWTRLRLGVGAGASSELARPLRSFALDVNLGWNVLIDEARCTPGPSGGAGWLVPDPYLRHTLAVVVDGLWTPHFDRPFLGRAAVQVARGWMDTSIVPLPDWELFALAGAVTDGTRAGASISFGATFMVALRVEARFDYFSRDSQTLMLSLGLGGDLASYGAWKRP